MPSERKLEANRRNARLSKGPKTPEGKAAVRFNALKHGLAAEHLVLDDEDRPQFDQLLAAYLAEYQPQHPTEIDLVHQLVAASWRLRRLRTLETALIELRLLDYERAFERDYTNLRPNKRLAYVFAHDTEEFTTLSRYEGRIERSFYRALHELQRLKAGRAGQPVPPPQVIEVHSPDDEGVTAPIGIVPSTAPGGSEPCPAAANASPAQSPPSQAAFTAAYGDRVPAARAAEEQRHCIHRFESRGGRTRDGFHLNRGTGRNRLTPSCGQTFGAEIP